MICEKCWDDAYQRAHLRGGTRADHYWTLILERVDRSCNLREQAGQFWDDEQQMDRRRVAVPGLEYGHEESA